LAVLLTLFCFGVGMAAVAPDGFCGYVSIEEMLVGGASMACAVFLLGLTIMAAIVYRHGRSSTPDERPLSRRLSADQFDPPRGRRLP
jgi:hypothetical protein